MEIHTFASPSIPTLKYSEEMEIEAVNVFSGFTRKIDRYFVISKSGFIADERPWYLLVPALNN